jgi:GlpG protein
MIGHLETERDAQAISNFLFVQGIENDIEPDKDNAWALWVHCEDELDRARSMLDEFKQSRDNPKYRKAAADAIKLKSQLEKEERAYRKKMVNSEQLRQTIGVISYGRISLIVIMLCGAVFFLSRFGSDMRAVRWLFISETISGGGLADRFLALSEVSRGQVWRLVTPVLLHFNVLHFFFNMLWLLDLGSMIEAKSGKGVFVAQLLAIALVSNLAQYLLTGPLFGGMSGVVYGLLGYVWMRGKFDPGSGLFLHPHTVIMMIIWFFFCFTGLVGNVANYTHAAGLAMGMAWGYLSAQMRRF